MEGVGVINFCRILGRRRRRAVGTLAHGMCSVTLCCSWLTDCVVLVSEAYSAFASLGLLDTIGTELMFDCCCCRP